MPGLVNGGFFPLEGAEIHFNTKLTCQINIVYAGGDRRTYELKFHVQFAVSIKTNTDGLSYTYTGKRLHTDSDVQLQISIKCPGVNIVVCFNRKLSVCGQFDGVGHGNHPHNYRGSLNRCGGRTKEANVSAYRCKTIFVKLAFAVAHDRELRFDGSPFCGKILVLHHEVELFL